MDVYSNEPSSRIDALRNWATHHPIAAVGIAIFLFFILGTPLLISYSVPLLSPTDQQKRAGGQPITPIPQPQTDPSKRPVAVSMPKAAFASYKNDSAPSSVPETVTIFTLKEQFSDEEVVSFGAKLGLSTSSPYGDNHLAVYSFEDQDKRGILQFDKRSGAFHYQSYGTLFPKNYKPGQSPQVIAESMLRELSLLDVAVTCDISYERIEFPGMTFIECHRAWDLLGLPLIDPVGILNLPEKQQITSVSLGKTDELTPFDYGIVKVTTNGGLVGRARPNDFNTITVAVAQDGRIYAIESTMRGVVSENRVTKDVILTPDEAISSLATNVPFMLVVPAGAGITDWDRVFPNNQAVAKSATITDIALIYTDKPMDFPLSTYEPSYLIRGISQLDNGYTVRFAAVVPAQKQTTSFSFTQQARVAGMRDPSPTPRNNIQIDTFTPSVSPQPTSTSSPFGDGDVDSDGEPTVTPAEPKEGEPPTSCENPGSARYYTITLDVPGYGSLYLLYNGAHTFFYKATTGDDKSIETVKDAFFTLVEEQYVSNVAWYLEQYPDKVSSLKTTADVFKLFAEMNGGRNRRAMKPKNPTKEAPLGGGQGAPPESEREQIVADVVARRILEAVEQNQITALAKKPNIFPDSTLTNFNWIFYFARDLRKGKNLTACYITGASPMVFFSAKKEMDIAVSLPDTVVYDDPSVREAVKLRTGPSGEVSTENSFERPYLYYEYDTAKVRWSLQNKGFVVASDDLDAFVRSTLSQKLRLNKKETDGLVQEIHSAIKNEPAQKYVSLSLISEEEINKKLPMKISPKPDVVRRVHVLLSYHSTKPSLQEQHITPLTRGEFTVIEFGAIVR